MEWAPTPKNLDFQGGKVHERCLGKVEVLLGWINEGTPKLEFLRGLGAHWDRIKHPVSASCVGASPCSTEVKGIEGKTEKEDRGGESKRGKRGAQDGMVGGKKGGLGLARGGDRGLFHSTGTHSCMLWRGGLEQPCYWGSQVWPLQLER